MWLINSFASAMWFLAPVESASYRIVGSPELGAWLSFTLRWMTVLNTSSWKWRFTSSYFWLAWRSRESYMVSRNPSISSAGFSLDLMILMVFSNLLMPSSAKYSACTGMITESAAVSALIVINPNDGEQSIRI